MAQTISTLGTAYLTMTSIGKIDEIRNNDIDNLNEDDFSCSNVGDSWLIIMMIIVINTNTAMWYLLIMVMKKINENLQRSRFFLSLWNTVRPAFIYYHQLWYAYWLKLILIQLWLLMFWCFEIIHLIVLEKAGHGEACSYLVPLKWKNNYQNYNAQLCLVSQNN